MPFKAVKARNFPAKETLAKPCQRTVLTHNVSSKQFKLKHFGEPAPAFFKAGKDSQSGIGRQQEFVVAELAQGFVEVEHQIIHRFNANRKPNQVIADSQLGTQMGRDGSMGHDGRMFNEAFHSAQALG